MKQFKKLKIQMAMKKIILFLSAIFIILAGCEGTNNLKFKFNAPTAEVKKRINKMIIEENFEIETNDPEFTATKWRKVTKDENNIPDYTIEGKVEANFRQIEDGTEVIFTVLKRSSLDSVDPDNPTYNDVGLILNDLLFRRWNEKLKLLQEELNKK